MKPIWIVDDDQSIRFVLEKALLREDLPTRSFTSPREVLAALENATEEDGPQVLVSDIRMPGGSGLELLEKVKEKLPGLPVIIMTAFSDLDSAVSAFQGGAFEYLPKPFDLPKAVELIRRAVEESQREEVAEERMAAAPEMLGQAPAMQDVFRAIGRLSQSMVTVMITGESGSGKELVARALHKHSPRANGPFVAINTAAIPKDLLESELFGHERGAFTGAQTMRRGRFEQAEGGTLFLDEVADLSLSAQAALLRVMQSGHLQRVGSDREHRVDVRIIAASNRDLADEVRAGRCRADFYHRISVYPIEVPALRDRGNDVLIVAGTFLEENRARLGLSGLRLAPESQAALLAWQWPGNVRELEHTIGRAALKALARSGLGTRALTIEAADLDLAVVTQPNVERVVPTTDAPGMPLRASVEAYERRLIEDALRRHRQSWAAAARELGVDRANLRRSALRLGLIDGPSRG